MKPIRALVGLFAGLVVAPLIVLVTATPASATDCTGAYLHASSPVSRADFVWDPYCAGGRSGIAYGSVTDTSCDDRQAKVSFDVYDRVGTRWEHLGTSRTYSAVNGCGSTAGFPVINLSSPGVTGWRLRVRLWSCSTTCSSVYDVNYTG